MIFVGIDPSAGARSSIGFCVVDLENGKILKATEFKISAHTELRKRIKEICVVLASEFKELEKLGVEYSIFYETTIMRGLGGESLQRAIGAMLAVCPSHRPTNSVSNMQLKLFVGGSGKADKREVAEGLKRFFPNSKDVIFNLIASSRFDTTDAIAVAVTGAEKYVYKQQIKQVKPKAVSKPKTSKAVKKSSSTVLDT